MVYQLDKLLVVGPVDVDQVWYEFQHHLVEGPPVRRQPLGGQGLDGVVQHEEGAVALGGAGRLDALQQAGHQGGPVGRDIESKGRSHILQAETREKQMIFHLAAFPTSTAICREICFTGSFRVLNSFSRMEHRSSSARALKLAE